MSAFRNLLATSMLLVVGCSTEEASPTTTDDASEIIDGTFAKSAKLDAVGKIRVSGHDICTGTLVSPRVVVTARHCLHEARNAGLRTQSETSFVVQRYEKWNDRGTYVPMFDMPFHVLEERVLPPSTGGLLGIGRDLAVFVLERAVPSDIAKPIPIRERPLDASDVGKKLLQVGFGLGGVAYTPIDIQRTQGVATLDAVTGKPYEKAFGTQAALDAYVASVEGRARPGAIDIGSALDDSAGEAHVGLVPGGVAPGDSQSCKGDSGGPMLERVGSKLALVGVISGGEFGVRVPCYLGTVIAVTTPELRSVVAQSEAGPPP